jgi:hypothetical protein
MKYLYFFGKNLIIIIIFLFIFIRLKKKIGVIGLNHGLNIGNNLIKYALHIKLTEFGFNPYMIGTNYRHNDISFLKSNTNYIIINKNYSEVKNKFDILMVNSDQTWRKWSKSDKLFYDIGFLKFAQNWSIPKFVYGASIGFDKWIYTKSDEKIIKKLLKNFTGISVREKSLVNLVKNHLGVKPIFVLDPTLLIDKKYYLNIIKDYNQNNFTKGKCIFTYIFRNETNTNSFIKYASKKLGYKIYAVRQGEKNSIKKFIYGMNNCNAVITNSYHGTVFSIIFKKPFITFLFKNSPKERLISLKDALKIKSRFYEYNQIPDIRLLTTPLRINVHSLESLRIRSINFLKKNLALL